MAFEIVESAGVRPAAASNSTLYTSTGATSALVTVTNGTTSVIDVRVAHRRGGDALDNTHYKLFDFELLGSDFITVGPFFMANGGILDVRCASTGVTFTMEGLSTA